jgi:hypothetical protein
MHLVYFQRSPTDKDSSHILILMLSLVSEFMQLSFLVLFTGVRLRIWTAASNGHIVHPLYDMSLESDCGMILTGEILRTRRKTCPSMQL